MKLIFVIWLLTAGFSVSAQTNQTALSEAPASEVKPKSDIQLFEELEKTFYSYQKSTDKKLDTKHLQQIESKFEKLLVATVKNVSSSDAGKQIRDLSDYQKRSLREVIALSQNYREAAHKAQFQSQITTYKVQSMCESYADAYKALAQGDFRNAAYSMERAQEKRDDLRRVLIK